VVSSSGMYCSSTRLHPGGHRRHPVSRRAASSLQWRRHPRGVTPGPADPCRGRRTWLWPLSPTGRAASRSGVDEPRS